MIYAYIAVSREFTDYAFMAIDTLRRYSLVPIIYDTYTGDAEQVNSWRTRRMALVFETLSSGDWLIKIDADMLFRADIAAFVADAVSTSIVVTSRYHACKYPLNAGIYAIKKTETGLSFMKEFAASVGDSWFDDQNFLCKHWTEAKPLFHDAGPLWNWTIRHAKMENVPDNARVLHFNRADKSEMQKWYMK